MICVKKFLLIVWRIICDVKHEADIQKNPRYRLNRVSAELIRNVHSIEKGLSIKNPRLGYGVRKIHEMLRLAEEYMSLTDDKTLLFFVEDALHEYLDFHRNAGYTNKELEDIAVRLDKLNKKTGSHEGVYGGTVIYHKEDTDFDIRQISRLFDTRHSIRSFSGEVVPEERIRRAIAMAQCAPSACNRQAVRVYSIKACDYVKLAGNMEGIGGFAQDADRFLLITGIESAYRAGERMQFAVSASMFAAYLSLALHALGIGACAVQRSLYENDEFAAFREKYGIQDDEQVVIMLAIGMVKEDIKVPLSRRLDIDTIYRNLNG